jgi:hypothetical protein
MFFLLRLVKALMNCCSTKSRHRFPGAVRKISEYTFFFAVLLIASGFPCNYEIMVLWNTYLQLGILIPNHHMKLQIFFTHACFTAAQYNWMIPREVLQCYNWKFAKSSTVDASLNNWSKLFTGIWEDNRLSSRPKKIPTLCFCACLGHHDLRKTWINSFSYLESGKWFTT